ncbi:hypothetical protein CEUSTIGMA_g6325.t1 [Chlamydomonas eustigma]|uniref:non-specific serine/threonine protein kinase n=1 Tax=Chlamydomonas eustigma TaxID=1157962 RepID=A0A250X760_9CHLO|nr:hypothetical protein CEUSTIGMA_g6325.t1 [Chlamydomonas eustigma]|eukprot:GAX78886.1 hypothetical protein CEUSTIGMA_g6325.t1 [Chlamydomonas eustigma]
MGKIRGTAALIDAVGDDRGITIGDVLKDGRYRIQGLLGFSNFSSVWLAKDSHLRTNVAIKATSLSSKSHAQVFNNELHVLSMLRSRVHGNPQAVGYLAPHAGTLYAPMSLTELNVDGGSRHHPEPVPCSGKGHFFVPLLDSFTWQGRRGHTVSCLVLRKLGGSLQSMIQQKKSSGHYSTKADNSGGASQFETQGLPMTGVKSLARDMLLALHILHSDLGLVHCDIKPGNILAAGRAQSSYCTSYCTKFSSAQSPSPLEDQAISSTRGITQAADGGTSARRPSWCLIDFGITFRSQRGQGINAEGSVINTDAVLTSGQTQEPEAPDWPDLGRLRDANGALIYRTVSYCPPEAVLGLSETPCPGYDVWSLACVTYEAATGKKLFDVQGSIQAAAAATTEASKQLHLRRTHSQPWWCAAGHQAWQAMHAMVLEQSSSSRELWDSVGRSQHGCKSECEDVEDAEDRHYLNLVCKLLGSPDHEVLARARNQDAVAYLASTGRNRLNRLLGYAGNLQSILSSFSESSRIARSLWTWNANSSYSCDLETKSDERILQCAAKLCHQLNQRAEIMLRLQERMMEDNPMMQKEDAASLSCFLEPLLNWDPVKRPSAALHRNHLFLADAGVAESA